MTYADGSTEELTTTDGTFPHRGGRSPPGESATIVIRDRWGDHSSEKTVTA